MPYLTIPKREGRGVVVNHVWKLQRDGKFSLEETWRYWNNDKSRGFEEVRVEKPYETKSISEMFDFLNRYTSASSSSSSDLDRGARISSFNDFWMISQYYMQFQQMQMTHFIQPSSVYQPSPTYPMSMKAVPYADSSEIASPPLESSLCDLASLPGTPVQIPEQERNKSCLSLLPSSPPFSPSPVRVFASPFEGASPDARYYPIAEPSGTINQETEFSSPPLRAEGSDSLRTQSRQTLEPVETTEAEDKPIQKAQKKKRRHHKKRSERKKNPATTATFSHLLPSDEVAELRSKIEELTSQVDQLTAEKSDLLEQNDALTAENKELKERSKRQSQQLSRIQTTIHNQKQQIESVEQKRREAEKQLDQEKERASKQQRKISKQQSEMKAQRDKMKIQDSLLRGEVVVRTRKTKVKTEKTATPPPPLLHSSTEDVGKIDNQQEKAN